LERREIGGQIGSDELKEMLELRQSLQTMSAQVTQGHAGGQSLAHQFGHGQREQRLSTMTG
jgi:hypothetical protein